MAGSSKHPAYALGIDIGGTKCAVILGACAPEESDGGVLTAIPQVLARREIATIKDGGYESTLQGLYAEADAMLSSQGVTAKDLCGIGISCGGPLDSKTGYSIVKNVISETLKKDRGVIEYDVYSSLTQPNKLLLLEIWENRMALIGHLNSTHFIKSRKKTQGLIVGTQHLARMQER